MEMYLKDREEVQNASKKPNPILDEVLGDSRLMAILNGLGADKKEIEDHLSLLATYLDQRDAEEDPKLPAPYPGLKMTLGLDSSGHLCAYFGPNDENKRKLLIEANYLYRDFPDEWVKLTPKALKGERYKAIRNEIGKTMKKGKPWVFVHGESGSGKSQYLAAISNYFAENGATVCFMNANQRFDELKTLALKNRDKFLSNMEALKACKVMVIDDFGNEYKSEYVRDQILMPILSERSRAGLKTYFTSQYSIDEIKTLYSLHGSILEGSKVSKIIERNIEKEVNLEPGMESFSRR